jgi:hypothetical protein
MATPIWNQSAKGLELIPGGTVEGANCLSITSNNEVIFWNQRGFGVSSLFDIAVRNSVCKRFTFLHQV